MVWGTGVDLDRALVAGRVRLKAGPWVFGWFGDEAARHGIAMNVAEFFDALVFGEDVEVVIAREPERAFREMFGDRAFEGAENSGEWVGWWFGE